MANTENKSDKVFDNRKDERVELFVERGYANDEPNELICVNGVNYVLPRGKKSMVPKFVADEYHRAKRAKERKHDNIEKLLGESK